MRNEKFLGSFLRSKKQNDCFRKLTSIAAVVWNERYTKNC